MSSVTIAGFTIEVSGTVYEGGIGGAYEGHLNKNGFGVKAAGEILAGLGFSFSVSKN